MCESIFCRVELQNCKLLGSNFYGSSILNVVLNACIADYSIFAESRFKNVVIKDTSLKKADFYNASFNRIQLFRVALHQAQLSGAKLKGLDFSECNIEGIGIRLEDLAGITITPLQAVDIIKSLETGINIKTS